MALVKCSACEREFEDDVLCCPHCGTAQIPQLTKAELRQQNLRASRGPYGAILAGTGVGLLLGAILLAVAVLQGDFDINKGLMYAAGVVLGGMLGGACGIVVHQLLLRREAKGGADRGPPPRAPGSPNPEGMSPDGQGGQPAQPRS